jgi:hypothetical protein
MAPAERVIEQLAKDQSPEGQLRQAKSTISSLERQLRDALRVIDVLVAVGKLKHGHVEEARTLVNAFSE